MAFCEIRHYSSRQRRYICTEFEYKIVIIDLVPPVGHACYFVSTNVGSIGSSIPTMMMILMKIMSFGRIAVVVVKWNEPLFCCLRNFDSIFAISPFRDSMGLPTSIGMTVNIFSIIFVLPTQIVVESPCNLRLVCRYALWILQRLIARFDSIRFTATCRSFTHKKARLLYVIISSTLERVLLPFTSFPCCFGVGGWGIWFIGKQRRTKFNAAVLEDSFDSTTERMSDESRKRHTSSKRRSQKKLPPFPKYKNIDSSRRFMAYSSSNVFAQMCKSRDKLFSIHQETLIRCCQ